MERNKFSFGRPVVMDEGVNLLERAYRLYTTGRTDKIAAIEMGMRTIRGSIEKQMPNKDTLVEYLTMIIEMIDQKKTIEAKSKRSARDEIINSVIGRIKKEEYEQIQMTDIEEKPEEQPETVQAEECEKQEESMDAAIRELAFAVKVLVGMIGGGITVTIRPTADT